jgi:hypothetical protein
MSIGSAAAAAMGGHWDVFDRVSGIIEDLMRRIQSLDPEDADRLFDYSMLSGELEVSGGPDELLETLANAREAFEEICTLCQHAEAALPE